MKRTWGLDVLRCPSCSGPMRLVALIEDDRTAKRILDHVGISSRAPPRGRPWRPGPQQLALDDDPGRFDGVDPPAAVAAATDALQRSTIGSGNGVGLRGGTFQTAFGANGQTTTLTNCAFASDVIVNGTVVWGSDFSFVADLTVSGPGTAGGSLHVEGTWHAPGPVGNFKVSGTLGGRRVAVLIPEA